MSPPAFHHHCAAEALAEQQNAVGMIMSRWHDCLPRGLGGETNWSAFCLCCFCLYEVSQMLVTLRLRRHRGQESESCREEGPTCRMSLRPLKLGSLLPLLFRLFFTIWCIFLFCFVFVSWT